MGDFCVVFVSEIVVVVVFVFCLDSCVGRLLYGGARRTGGMSLLELLEE